MAINNYGLVRVRVLIQSDNKDIFGDNTLQALCELFPIGVWVFSVNPSLKDVIRDGDLALVDQGMVSIPNTNQAFPKNEIIKIIRGKAQSESEKMLNETLKNKPIGSTGGTG